MASLKTTLRRRFTDRSDAMVKNPTAEVRQSRVRQAISVQQGDFQVLRPSLSRQGLPRPKSREGKGRNRRPLGEAPGTGAADRRSDSEVGTRRGLGGAAGTRSCSPASPAETQAYQQALPPTQRGARPHHDTQCAHALPGHASITQTVKILSTMRFVMEKTPHIIFIELGMV